MGRNTILVKIALASLGLGLLCASVFSGAAGTDPQALTRGSNTPAAQVIELVLDSKSFVPIDLYRNGGEIVPPTWLGCNPTDIMSKLKGSKPEFITREPRYRGARQMYGYLTLGTQKNKNYYFAMDIITPDNMLMYFDFNKNGRLDDDGPPLKHAGHFEKGENGFATLIEIPWEQLAEASPYRDKFKIWFFINSFQWANTGFSHASHTQLKGTVDIGGVPYTVIIADRAENDNDADLSNDGLYLRRGKEEPRYISASEAKAGVLLDKKRYIFQIKYPAASRILSRN